MAHTTCNGLDRVSTLPSSPYPGTPLYAGLLIAANRHHILLALHKHLSDFYNAIDPVTSTLNPFISSLLSTFEGSIRNSLIPYHCKHSIESAQSLPMSDSEFFEWLERLYWDAVALREVVKLIQGIIYLNQGKVDGWLDTMKPLGEQVDTIEEMLRKEYFMKKEYMIKKLVVQLRERVGMLDKAVAEFEKEGEVGHVDEWIDFEVLDDLDEVIEYIESLDMLKPRK